jgi:IS5 family transposase
MDSRDPLLKQEQKRNHLRELKRKVGYVHHRWIGANVQLTLKDLVEHCKAELELQKSHLKDAQELSALLDSDANFYSIHQSSYRMPSISRVNILEEFSSWIDAMPSGKMDDLIVILVNQRDKLAEYKLCVESGDPPVIHPSDESDTDFEEWIMDHHCPDDLVDQMNFRLGIFDSYIETLELYKYVCASDFTLSELKSTWDDSGRAYRIYIGETNDTAQKAALSYSKKAADAAKIAADKAVFAADAAKKALSTDSKNQAQKAVKAASTAAALAAKAAQEAVDSVDTMWRKYTRKEIYSQL